MNQPLTPEQPKHRKNHEADEFTHGYLTAASQVMRAFDNPTIAVELMKTAGVTSRRELRAARLDKFDLDPLLEVCKQEGIR